MTFPPQRPRRLRSRPALRRLARETRIAPEDLIYPLFVRDAIDEPRPIEAMPGHYQHTLESLTREVEAALKVGVGSFVVFGIPAQKDAQGSQAWAEDGISQRALRQLRNAFGADALLIADLCLCEYTEHGHCGVLEGETVANDPTVELYQRIAVAQAAAGADVIAPSGMMDGQVGAIRSALDREGFTDRAVLAYAAQWPTGGSGRGRDRRRGWATGAATRWIPPMRARPSARRAWMSKKAPTSSWSSPRSRTSTSSARSRTQPRSRSPHTTSAANTAWSRPPPPTAGSTNAACCGRSCSGSGAPAPR